MASLPLIATLIKASTSLFLIILLLNSPSCTEAENILYPGETLQRGRSLTYGSSYRLTMERNCNLVLFDAERVVWQTFTARPIHNCFCTVKNTGQLVILNPEGRVLWRSGATGSEGKYVLVLESGPKLVIYGPSLWSTGTNRNQTAADLILTSVAAA